MKNRGEQLKRDDHDHRRHRERGRHDHGHGHGHDHDHDHRREYVHDGVTGSRRRNRNSVQYLNRHTAVGFSGDERGYPEYGRATVKREHDFEDGEVLDVAVPFKKQKTEG